MTNNKTLCEMGYKGSGSEIGPVNKTFDIELSKEAALELLMKHGGTTIGDMMYKEFGDNDDWVCVTGEDLEMLQGEEYQTFKIRLHDQYRIAVGNRVRSYDFSGISNSHYIEGVVSAIGRFDMFPDCDRYEIKGDVQMWEGRRKERFETYYPPINGTPKLFGGICEGVIKISKTGEEAIKRFMPEREM